MHLHYIRKKPDFRTVSKIGQESFPDRMTVPHSKGSTNLLQHA